MSNRKDADIYFLRSISNPEKLVKYHREHRNVSLTSYKYATWIIRTFDSFVEAELFRRDFAGFSDEERDDMEVVSSEDDYRKSCEREDKEYVAADDRRKINFDESMLEFDVAIKKLTLRCKRQIRSYGGDEALEKYNRAIELLREVRGKISFD